MELPKHDELRIPVLQYLSKHGETRAKDLVKPISKVFQLSDEQVNQMYSSGNGPVFYDRLSWTLSFLYMADLVDKPKRGLYKINETGRKYATKPNEINVYIDKKVAEREKEKERSNASNQYPPSSELTPQEKLYNTFTSIREAVYTEIISTILSKSPNSFERLVVLLLQKMGYGGEVENSGLVTKRSNDGGIDGIIKEDILGLGRIHIQAKRYDPKNSVGREEIQKFVGALAVADSNKGVFITTSYYSKGALNYAQSLNGSTTLVLIDGKKLAEYIYDFSLGMQTEQTIEIKKLDADFWDTMADDNLN